MQHPVKGFFKVNEVVEELTLVVQMLFDDQPTAYIYFITLVTVIFDSDRMCISFTVLYVFVVLLLCLSVIMITCQGTVDENG